MMYVNMVTITILLDNLVKFTIMAAGGHFVHKVLLYQPFGPIVQGVFC